MSNRKLLAATAAAVLALSGCAGDGDDTTAGPATSPGAATGETSVGETSATSTATAEDAEHSAADVRFARMMIPHHQQAIEMSDRLLSKDDVPADVKTMAEDIKAAQVPEMQQLAESLEQWGEPAGWGPQGGPWTGDDMGDQMGDHMGDAGYSAEMPMMDGMLTAEEMQELSDARGTDSARLFLEQMIFHHEGAIDMAEDAVSDGTHPPTVGLAKTIIDTQQREIDEMRDMIAAL